MKRYVSCVIAFVSLLAVCFLGGCHYKADALINGKADLPIPDVIVLRNNETGLTREFDAASEEFDHLYRSLNQRWGMYGDKKTLAYYMMKYTFQGETPPTCEVEFRFAPGSVSNHNVFPDDSDDVIGVIIALDKGADKAAYIFDDVEDYRDVTALVYQPSDDTLDYVLSLLNQ